MSEPVEPVEPADSEGAANLDPLDPDRAPRPRIKDLEVMVADVVMEGPDTATLVLFTGNDRLDYRPGHFLTVDPHQFHALERFIDFFEDAKGKKEPPRAYSLTSAPHERHLAITVKEERYVSRATRYPPLLSPLLVWRTPRGTRMQVTGFGGPYVLPRDIESRTDHLVHVCAGSGIVPNFSMLKHALETGLRLRHTLVYGNKTWREVIFRRQLEELERRFPDKLEIVHALSREAPTAGIGGKVRAGRVGAELLREVIRDPGAVEVFACGPGINRFDREAAKARGETPPPRFLESVVAALAELGLPKQRVHRESYG